MRLLLALLCLLLPGAAEAAWRQASTPHFLIYSEQKPEELRDFATRLERFDQAMRKIRGMADLPLGPSNRLTVYVVPSVSSVQKIGPRSRNLAGFYIPRAGGSIAIVPRRAGSGGRFDLDAEGILLHEYAHHFMMAEGAGIAYPAWLVEGFAEVNSTAEFGVDGSINLGIPAAHRLYGLAMGSLPVETLLTSSADLRDPRSTEMFYARSWLLTHYLTFHKPRRGQLATYLKAFNSGKPSLNAAKEVFGDLKKLDSELDVYLRARRMPGLRFSFKELQIGEIELRDLSPAENAVMDLRIRSDRGVDRAEATRLLARMRQVAAGYPNDPTVQAYLAEAEYDAGNQAEAVAAADRALAADPSSIDALLYRGRSMMAQALASGSRDPATWKEIRRWIIKANNLDKEHAEPLWFYYQTFPAIGAKPDANAVQALLKAHDLAPQDRTLRMAVARQHLIDGKAAEARTALAPIAFDPHGGARAKLATALLTLLGAGDAKAALQAWKQGEKSTVPAS